MSNCRRIVGRNYSFALQREDEIVMSSVHRFKSNIWLTEVSLGEYDVRGARRCVGFAVASA